MPRELRSPHLCRPSLPPVQVGVSPTIIGTKLDDVKTDNGSIVILWIVMLPFSEEEEELELQD